MIKILSLILVIVLVLSCVGCAQSDKAESSALSTIIEQSSSTTSSKETENMISSKTEKEEQSSSASALSSQKTDTSSKTTQSSSNTNANTNKTEPTVKTEYDTDFLTFRTGLPNTYACLAGEKELTISYIGGSITAGASASDPTKTSWRPLVTAWLREKFPKAKITEINTAVGSSGSMLPVFYMDERVVPHKPDLVFLELAINDHLAGYSDEQVSVQYETIIRKLLAANPYCEFVAVYTTNDVVSATEKLFPQAAVQDSVAEHYGIASINVGRRMRTERGLVNPKTNGEYTNKWKAFFADSVHPTDVGHKLYANYVIELLGKAFADAAKSKTPKTQKTLPVQKNKQLMTKTYWVETTDFDLSSSKGWKHAGADKGFSSMGVKDYIYTDTTDNELVYTFKGSNLYFFSSAIPYDGTAPLYEYSVDGGKWTVMAPCGAHPTRVVTELENGTHTVRFRAGGVAENAKKKDYETFSIGAFLSW